MDVLSLMSLRPNAFSADYVSTKTPFQLHKLVTEQRHPATWTLSATAAEDAAKAVEAMFEVDRDVSAKMNDIANNHNK